LADKFEHLHVLCDDYLEGRRSNDSTIDEKLSKGFDSFDFGSESANEAVIKMDEEWEDFETEQGNLSRSIRSVKIGWVILSITGILSILSISGIYFQGRILGIFLGFAAIGLMGVVNGRRVNKESIQKGKLRRMGRRRWISNLKKEIGE
jgi:hypothetical protein